MVTVPHEIVGLARMSDYRGVGLERFHCSGLVLHCPQGPNTLVHQYTHFHVNEDNYTNFL